MKTVTPDHVSDFVYEIGDRVVTQLSQRTASEPCEVVGRRICLRQYHAKPAGAVYMHDAGCSQRYTVRAVRLFGATAGTLYGPEHEVPVSQILALTDEKPLFGNRCGKTAKSHWIVFQK